MTRSGVAILVEGQVEGQNKDVVLAIRAESRGPLLLHWGLRRSGQPSWELPPAALWPPGSHPFGDAALQTPIGGEHQLQLRLPSEERFRLLEFALFSPESRHWDNNGGQNYRVQIQPRSAVPPREVLRLETAGYELLEERTFDLEGEGELALAVIKLEGARRALLLTDRPSLLLHWGIADSHAWEWRLPPAAWLPEGSELVQGGAETPFREQDGLFRLCLELPEAELPLGLPFVLREAGTSCWLKDNGRNFFLKLAPRVQRGSELAQTIIEHEAGTQSWTLMHRFNLCHDLLDSVAPGAHDDLALIFVWLRYSAIRQLDWQRNYNTKPRELSHAQHRLTQKLAARYAAHPEDRELIRLIMTTVGRGGEGQRVRDEILHIMHRHHIKEVSGHFLEEWHQKLHNNATPDDIVICQAYLDFLRSNGSREVFYRALQAGGVTRERLQGYERPIRSDPDYHAHLRDGLLQDFSAFLSVRKEFHSATDLATIAAAVRGQLDVELRSLLDAIREAPASAALVGQVERATAARRRLADLIERHAARDLIYLDLALEDYLRQLIEASPRSEGQLALLCGALENLLLSYPGEDELERCLRHLRRLSRTAATGREQALHLHAALERLGRGMSELIDRRYQRLQPTAEELGTALQVAAWARELFTEEVVRGRIEFAVSLLLRRLLAEVREAAAVGKWQVISRSKATGRVRTVVTLGSIEGHSFAEPVIVVANEVHGDELIPDRVAAVITSDTVDVVSHVAVRARNAGVLFATCFDAEAFESLRQRRDDWLELRVNASGDVVEDEASQSHAAVVPAQLHRVTTRRERVKGLPFAIAEHAFAKGLVGCKSRSLQHLRGLLPDWIKLPSGVAIPAGAMERVLDGEHARPAAKRYRELATQADKVSDLELMELIPELRRIILSLETPPELFTELRRALEDAGLPLPADWREAWHNIKEVWASIWGPQASRSRRALGIQHSELAMAVLIQAVVPAEYSFVIHTVSPISGRSDEIYAEVVCGLGETLVGNYPGRALGFVYHKPSADLRLLCFPSKSVALRGRGLIFRSDSNGEDLAGYAGAGLYTSLLLPPARREVLDYTDERLLWDAEFRVELLRGIGALGRTVEEALARPQDIEGAWVQGTFYVVQARPQVGLGNG